MNAILIGVFHNSIGQTLEISTATIALASAGNLTVGLIMNLPNGNHTINVFAWATSGAALSPEQTITC